MNAVCALRNLDESGGPYVCQTRAASVLFRRKEERKEEETHPDKVVVEREGGEDLCPVFRSPCVCVLFDRVNRDGVVDRLDQARVLRSDKDTEAARSTQTLVPVSEEESGRRGEGKRTY